jgi:hypothetical protein
MISAAKSVNGSANSRSISAEEATASCSRASRLSLPNGGAIIRAQSDRGRAQVVALPRLYRADEHYGAGHAGKPNEASVGRRSPSRPPKFGNHAHRYIAIAMARRGAGRTIKAIAGRRPPTTRDWAARDVRRRRCPLPPSRDSGRQTATPPSCGLLALSALVLAAERIAASGPGRRPRGPFVSGSRSTLGGAGSQARAASESQNGRMTEHSRVRARRLRVWRRLGLEP